MNNRARGILSPHDLQKPANRILYALMMLVIALMVCTMLYPILITFFNAFKENREVISFPPTFLPTKWVWGNFEKGWVYIDLLKYVKNTLLIFVGNIVSIIFILGMAAYSLSKLRLPKRRWIVLYFMTTLFIPSTTYIIPNFINLRDLGLINTFWAFWLPAAGSAFYLFVIKTFFDDIHNELLEAARVDGASEFRSYLQIVLPLSVPIFATLSIFVFASAWNDWFWPSLVLNGEKYPLATAIYRFVIQARRLDLNVRFAILSIVMVPPIVLFLFFQKFVMRGLQLTGLKG